MQAQFLELNGRRLFCQRVRAAAARQRLLVLPPFGEELNKCRRLLALCVRGLATDGHDVLWPDLFGTGDSGGNFEDANWELWRADVAALAAWHLDECGQLPAAVLAVRSGTLLLEALPAACRQRVVMWQPVLDGARFLQQFLRLRVMSERMSGGSESLADLERALSDDGQLEVAGYMLNGALASGMREAQLGAASLAGSALVHLLEFKTSIEAAVSVPTQRFASALIDAGIDARTQCVTAEQFWATQEISAPLEVVTATRAAFATS